MQHSKIVQLVIITSAVISLLLVSTTYSNYTYAQEKFRAKLEADNQVPPVDSKADGVATFKIVDDAIKSKINITGITDVSGAQILMGTIGQNGDPIVDLLKTGEEIENPGGIAIQGNFTASDFEGSMEGKDVSALQSAMAANQTFVNIMTSAHPDGEISGHIYSKGSTTGAADLSESSAISEGEGETSEEGNGEDEEGNGNGEDEEGNGEDEEE
jgi:hypothetical protein